MPKYKFPVGDWSGDGHRECDHFIVEGDKHFDDVVAAHKNCESLYGFNIGSICGDYEEDNLSEDLVDKLINKVGLDLRAVLEESYIDFTNYSGGNSKELEFDQVALDSENIICLWMAILNKIDPSLNLRLADEESIPSMHVVDVPGYGVFF